MASACRLLLIGLLGAAAVDAPAREPRVERVAEPVVESSLLAALPSGVAGPNGTAGLYLVGGVDSPLAWLRTVGEPARFGLAEPLPGTPAAAAGLSASTVALITIDEQQDGPTARLLFLRCGEVGRFSTRQTVPLPEADASSRWSLAANRSHLFVGVGAEVFRSRYTAGGMSEPKRFVRSDKPIVSLAIDGKGYLVALTRRSESAAGLLFFDPTRASMAPAASYDLPLAGAQSLAYALAEGDPSPRLYAASPAGVHRVDVAADTRGAWKAAPTRVWSPPGPVRSLAGVGYGKGARPLHAVAGEALFRITPQPFE